MSDLTSTVTPLISPTKARRDAAQARDWAHVSSWLTDKYSPQPVPRFEGNADTLGVLLELVASNELADREAELVRRAQEEEWRRYEAVSERDGGPCQAILAALKNGMDGCGTRALVDLAEASLLLGTLSADSSLMGERIMELSHEKFEAEEQLRRISDLQRQLEREVETMNCGIQKIESQVDEVAEGAIHQQTMQLNREVKQLTTKMEQYNEQIIALERYTIASPNTLEVKEQERIVSKLQIAVKALERQVADLHGLPPDLERAREECQRAQNELQEMRKRRDGLFERMAERDS